MSGKAKGVNMHIPHMNRQNSGRLSTIDNKRKSMTTTKISDFRQGITVPQTLEAWVIITAFVLGRISLLLLSGTTHPASCREFDQKKHRPLSTEPKGA